MVTLSTAEETILQSDRVPMYIGTNGFQLKKGVIVYIIKSELIYEVLCIRMG